jgi:hypothetical protein
MLGSLWAEKVRHYALPPTTVKGLGASPVNQALRGEEKGGLMDHKRTARRAAAFGLTRNGDLQFA